MHSFATPQAYVCGGAVLEVDCSNDSLVTKRRFSSGGDGQGCTIVGNSSTPLLAHGVDHRVVLSSLETTLVVCKSSEDSAGLTKIAEIPTNVWSDRALLASCGSTPCLKIWDATDLTLLKGVSLENRSYSTTTFWEDKHWVLCHGGCLTGYDFRDDSRLELYGGKNDDCCGLTSGSLESILYCGIGRPGVRLWSPRTDTRSPVGSMTGLGRVVEVYRWPGSWLLFVLSGRVISCFDSRNRRSALDEREVITGGYSMSQIAQVDDDRFIVSNGTRTIGLFQHLGKVSTTTLSRTALGVATPYEHDRVLLMTGAAEDDMFEERFAFGLQMSDESRCFVRIVLRETLVLVSRGFSILVLDTGAESSL